MDGTNAWEAFVRTGLVCDYLQYVAENRHSAPGVDAQIFQQDNEKGTKTPCSVLRTES